MFPRTLMALLLAIPLAAAAASSDGSLAEPPSASQPTSTQALPRRFRIVTYNILGGRGGLEKIAKFLREQDADVICLQEVLRDRVPASGAAGTKPAPSSDQAVRVAEMLGGMQVVSATTLRLPAEQECNVAILSRYPIRESAAYSLEAGGWVYAVRATLSEAGIEAAERPKSAAASQRSEEHDWQVHVFSVHLHSTHRLEIKHIMESSRTRMSQVAGLLGKVQKVSGDVIVAGDFNAAPWMPEYLALTQTLTDLGPKSAKESPTFPASQPAIRIDYVFGRGPFAARTYGPVVVPLSDHLPVIAEIERGLEAKDAIDNRAGQRSETK
jgi:endonuclease/exonuclease/phosphatase family metal-dependent hydrolase